MSRRRHAAVRLGIPGAIVAILAIVALCRVGTPPPSQDALAIGTTGTASLEATVVRQVTSPRTFWVGAPREMETFVVLDPDVRRIGIEQPTAGQRVTLLGVVRPAPRAADAMKQWGIDRATAESLHEAGTYLHATEIRASTR